jgi:DNA-binding MarR family transcriptional regulator
MSTENQPGAPHTDTDFALWRLLNHTTFVINRSREKELAQFHITPEQAHVMDVLHHSGGTATIQDIVNITMRQHHSISTLLNRMTLQGLIKKTKSPTDARQYSVTFTPKGQTLFSKITHDTITEIFSVLSERDQKGLHIKLKKLMMKTYKVLGKKFQRIVYTE